ncbi:MAG TPA: TRAP transporter substrate-binding protein [Candidatus Acidoferrum sp.]|nr:TRAP transporter substrate-binding protein [Candidatus Acidoferrum sp.]
MKAHRWMYGLGVALLVLSFLVWVGAGSAEAQVLRMKFAHFADEGHPGHLAAKMFAENVEKRTNGQIKIDIFPNNMLGSPPEQAEQIRLGTTDMGLPTQGQFDKWIKAMGVVMLPFAYDDYDHVHRTVDGPAFQWFSQMAEKEGFILLSNWEYGFRNLTNNKRPVNAPEDVKGLKVRVPPEMQIGAAFEALGAQTTVIAFPELYMALAQGVADGEDNPVSVIYFMKFYEVQKHLALTRHIYNNMIHTISAKTWAKLTPEQKAIFQEESRKAGASMRQQIVSQEGDLVAKMQQAGTQVTRPNLALFRAAMKPAYEKIGKYAGEENVKKFLEYVEAARKK